MGQKHVYEVIWDSSVFTFIKKIENASLKMSTACNSWRFLNTGVVCELYLAFDMYLPIPLWLSKCNMVYGYVC